MFDALLVIAFVGSAGVLWYRISQKIPELVAIPDEVIVERLHEDSARIRVFLLNLKRWWREEQYREPLWKFCEKIIYRLHILMLRADNGIVGLLKKVRVLGGLPNGNGNVHAEPLAPEADRSATEAPLPPARIQEVRRRKVKSAVPE
jgi:hypothetical protein